MTDVLYFDDLAVGQCWNSPARPVTEADVLSFAALTGDHDPLHVDREFAQQSHFGQPIAHGLLGLSLVAGLASEHPRVRNVAFVEIRQWKFLKPVLFGDTVHAVVQVAEKRPSGRRRGRVTWKRSLVNQHNQTVQEGYFETLVAVRTPVPRPHIHTQSADANAADANANNTSLQR